MSARTPNRDEARALLLRIEAGTQVLCHGHLVGRVERVQTTLGGGTYYDVRYPWMRENRVYRVEPADCVPLQAVPFEWGF